MKKLLLPFVLLLFSVPLFSQNHQPTAVNDSVTCWNNDTIIINARANDFDVDGDPIRIFNITQPFKHGLFLSKTDSTIIIFMSPDYFGSDSLQYRIREISNDGSTGLLFDSAWVFLNVQNGHSADSVDINNINACINSNGNMFWDLIGTAKFEVPKGSGKTSIFNSTLWIAGLDSIDTLHVAAQRYNLVGRDFWSGPISNVYDSAYDAKWDRVWKIKKTDIDYHLAHCWLPNYVPIQALIDWPGNGDTTLGQPKITAPFYDWNNDGIYNPYGGDFPLIKGDETVYFIYNDDRKPHTESHGNKLGVEIHGMAYEYNCPDDSALWNTLFINYKIYNRSNSIYHDTYIGVYSDLDIGYMSDDYIGSDVQRGSYYGYNGTDVDGTGQPQAYGTFPPAQSVTILGGPYMDPDGIDNPSGLCDAGINGTNFGNGTIDDERLGLGKFIFYNNNSGIMGDPQIAIDYYNYMQGKWKDSTRMQWGGNAHAPGPGVCGPECNFMFPGDTDPCMWGTAGLTPNCAPFWTEKTVGNQPADRRGFGSSGPFTFEPGSEQELDIAYVFGRNYVDSTAWGITNAWKSVNVIQQRIDSIRKYYVNDSTPCGLSFSGIVPSPIITPQIKIFPNPAVGYITVDATGILCDLNYVIYDILGREISQGILKCTSSNQIYIAGLQNGMYIINVSDGKKKVSRKFIKQ